MKAYRIVLVWMMRLLGAVGAFYAVSNLATVFGFLGQVGWSEKQLGAAFEPQLRLFLTYAAYGAVFLGMAECLALQIKRTE